MTRLERIKFCGVLSFGDGESMIKNSLADVQALLAVAEAAKAFLLKPDPVEYSALDEASAKLEEQV